MWLEILGFKEKIKDRWKETDVSGLASFVFGQKLKILKEKILRWKKLEFGGLKARKNICLHKLSDLDNTSFNDPNQEVDSQSKSKVLSEYNGLLRMEEIA